MPYKFSLPKKNTINPKLKNIIKPNKKYFEDLVDRRIIMANLPVPQTQYKFLIDRKFKFDFAWPDRKIALECEGGVYIRGRHTRPMGFINDCRKYNLAALNGWTVLRYTPDMLKDIIDDLRRIFKNDNK